MADTTHFHGFSFLLSSSFFLHFSLVFVLVADLFTLQLSSALKLRVSALFLILKLSVSWVESRSRRWRPSQPFDWLSFRPSALVLAGQFFLSKNYWERASKSPARPREFTLQLSSQLRSALFDFDFDQVQKASIEGFRFPIEDFFPGLVWLSVSCRRSPWRWTVFSQQKKNYWERASKSPARERPNGFVESC